MARECYEGLRLTKEWFQTGLSSFKEVSQLDNSLHIDLYIYTYMCAYIHIYVCVSIYVLATSVALGIEQQARQVHIMSSETL